MTIYPLVVQEEDDSSVEDMEEGVEPAGEGELPASSGESSEEEEEYEDLYADSSSQVVCM